MKNESQGRAWQKDEIEVDLSIMPKNHQIKRSSYYPGSPKAIKSMVFPKRPLYFSRDL